MSHVREIKMGKVSGPYASWMLRYRVVKFGKKVCARACVGARKSLIWG